MNIFCVDRLSEYQEEIEVLKAERDHLERSNMDLRKKVASLKSMQMTPVSVNKYQVSI
jgi:cell division protein FtsB